jgi:uncharacterized membrane protein SpoIIM required for sporulation
MRETSFFNKNKNKWNEIDVILTDKKAVSPDQLSNLFIQLTDDLAYAQSNFPESKTTQYLNQLTANIHQRIYKNKKEKLKRLQTFWVTELPLLFYRQRKNMRISLIIFLVSLLIGIFSTIKDESFVRLILGDEYVNMTIENIAKGNPLGVYSNTDALPMFLHITFNNITVSSNVFIAGVIFSIASAYLIFKNGIMLGCFQYFFYAKHLLSISILTLWVHGVFEITSIVIAGGAGIALGNSIMFPGTYSRFVSFQKTALETVKIIAGLIPFFIIAGFLEAFVTRYSHTTTIPAIIIITLSSVFVLFYFIYYPYLLNKKQQYGK